MNHQNYVQLNEEQINVLKNNGCSADDWSQVLVASGFDPVRLRNIEFEGKVLLGCFDGEVVFSDNSKKKASIKNATLNNVEIGDNCYIANINVELYNLKIESGVVIENVGKIACIGESTFGNGYEIDVLNEGGGRELKITRETNAQNAYLTVLYRDNSKLINKLNEFADNYCEKVKCNKATISKNANIFNCNEIINVFIGESAVINGAASLREGSIDSSSEAPTLVGNGVIAENFIFQKGSSVKDGAMVASSLVGEGSKVGKQFSSENSVFFANSEGFHSEVCSIFAGPYSVTHHRSTLLIAGMFSFFNAGSGTNQSNHMYKLGPVHQGILERGCKTGSSSYLLWPSRVGAFTAVIGKHYANFNTSDLPFSYINESGGKSTIIPGMNFFTTGTFRDGLKWPVRDRRKNNKKLDLIVFDVLSPYSIQKVIKGQNILSDLYKAAEKSQEYVTYNGILIKRLLLKTCKRYYKLIVDKYFGDVLINRLMNEKPAKIRDILKYGNDVNAASAEWIDVSGLLCSKNRLDSVNNDIVNGKINSLDELYNAFKDIYDVYRDDEWNWFLTKYKELNGVELSEESDENLEKFINSWKESSLKLLNMVSQDSKKEFEGNVRLGFGIDGNANQDFDNVRGLYEENSFIININKDIDELNTKHIQIMKMI